MKKNIIILGNASSGKTLKAKEISKKYLKHNVTWINGSFLNYNNPFIFSNCTKNTELLIFDNVNKIEIFEYLRINNPIIVNKPMELPFVINPNIILVCEENITRDLSPNYFSENNFDFIQLK